MTSRAWAAPEQGGPVRFARSVHGTPSPAVGSIVAPLLEQAGGDRRDPKVVVDPQGRPARTDYEVVRSVRHMTLVKVQPQP